MSKPIEKAMTIFCVSTSLIAKYNGPDKCFAKLKEESAEFIQAADELTKDLENEILKHHFLEELADMVNVINEIKTFLTQEELSEFGEISFFKVRRTLRRMNPKRLKELELDDVHREYLKMMDACELPLVPGWIAYTDKTNEEDD